MCASSLCIKTVSNVDGVRNIIVNPNHKLAVLKDFKNADCKLVYKMKIVVEDFTFKEYSMIDGDIIYFVSPKPNNKHIRELEREKLRLMDLKLNAIEGSNRRSQKFTCNKINYIDSLARSIEQDNSYKILRMIKQTHPCNTELPRFWTK